MTVGEVPEPADLLVVGGGPGGYVAAIRAAQLGRRVMLVDRDEWGGPGGACLHVGCIPSKALIELADALARIAAGASPGLRADGVTADMAAFQHGKRETVDTLVGGVGALLRSAGVDVRQGELRFTGPRRAVVAGADRATHVEFSQALIATGTRPVAPVDGPSVDGVRVLDSSGLLALERVPESLCLVGAGYVGLELGTAFAKLGARVTIVEQEDALAGGFEPEVRALLERSLRALGVDLLLRSRLVDLDGDQAVVVPADGAGAERRVDAEVVGIAAGRRPNTDGLGLDALGIEPDADGRIAVDAARLAAPHVAAVGDVTAGPALAHKATAEALVAVAALSGRPAAFDPAAIPVVMFTDPEVAVAGVGAGAASEHGAAASPRFPVSALGRAATLGRTDGFVRLVTDAEDGTLMGAEIVGPHASELIAEAVLAIEMGATLEDLALTVHPHPTVSEGITEAAELALGTPVHVPLPKPRKPLLTGACRHDSLPAS